MLEDMCYVAYSRLTEFFLSPLLHFILSLIHSVSIVLTVNTYRIRCACLNDIISSKTFNHINYI